MLSNDTTITTSTKDAEQQHGNQDSHVERPLSEKVHKFAFIVHPLTMAFLHKHPLLKGTKILPDSFVERSVSRLPPRVLSKIVGGYSAKTGQRVEGLLMTMFSTPRVMVGSKPEKSYKKIVQATKIAEKWGAKVFGLGAFTSVVGDAGVTVAQQSPIPVTTGNTLTVVTALETVEKALEKLGRRLTKAMVIGATGSIGSACARMMAQEGIPVVLVAPKLEKLKSLKDIIEKESPTAQVEFDTSPDTHAPYCNAIITTTSAFGQRILDMSTLKPGSVVIDVARPSDISDEEASLRKDVVVIESGEVLLPPGNVDIGYNIGLPRHVAYACLAETALLAMDGRFESFSLGRSFDLTKIRTLRQLYRDHGLQLAPFRSTSGRVLSDGDFEAAAELAAQLERDCDRLGQLRMRTKQSLSRIVPSSKGIQKTSKSSKLDIQTNCPCCKKRVVIPFVHEFSRRRNKRALVSPEDEETHPGSDVASQTDIGSNQGYCKDCAADIFHV
mmetsp:Transcript_7476/g.20730  ORF Transcript_7476/g.20730 Transcript_7476/m.20730 type:complete len:499 (-) Transcript_7476:126-1622(-)